MSQLVMERPGVGCMGLLIEALGASRVDDVTAVLVKAGDPWAFGLDAGSVVLIAVIDGWCWMLPSAVHRLVDVLVLQLLRAWMAPDQPDGVQWHPTAPADELVSAALDLIHTEPARQWTIGTLAAQVGLSRAAFPAFHHGRRTATLDVLDPLAAGHRGSSLT